MIVSPRNSWRASIVAGLRVATNLVSASLYVASSHHKHIPELSSAVASSTIKRFGLQSMSSTPVMNVQGVGYTYDFFGLRMAVAVSSLGAGCAPLGSARVSGMSVVVKMVEKRESSRRCWVRKRRTLWSRATRVPSPHSDLGAGHRTVGTSAVSR